MSQDIELLKLKFANYTPSLEDALCNLRGAKESRGLYVYMPIDPIGIREMISELAEAFSGHGAILCPPGVSQHVFEANCLDNLILLCNALREHFKAGN